MPFTLEDATGLALPIEAGVTATSRDSLATFKLDSAASAARSALGKLWLPPLAN